MAESYEIVTDPVTDKLIRLKAQQLCRRCDFSTSDREDLEQGMRLHLLEKAHLFDPKRGELSSFVNAAINAWVGMQLRHRDRLKRAEPGNTISLESAHVLDGEETVSLADVLTEEDGRRRMATESISDMEQFELRDEIEHTLKNLHPKDRAIVSLVAESNVASAAETLGISRRRVQLALSRARTLFEQKADEPATFRSISAQTA